MIERGRFYYNKKSVHSHGYKKLPSGFETQRRRHQKSKTWVLVAPEKGLMSSKIFFKNVPLPRDVD